MSVCAQTSGHCPQHGAYAGGPCAECAAAQQRAEDIDTRFSTHHSLWQAVRHDIAGLQQAENRQDAALTEVEASVAELGALYDRIAQLERKVAHLSTLLMLDLKVMQLEEEL
jgi:hypothetical protein